MEKVVFKLESGDECSFPLENKNFSVRIVQNFGKCFYVKIKILYLCRSDQTQRNNLGVDDLIATPVEFSMVVFDEPDLLIQSVCNNFKVKPPLGYIVHDRIDGFTGDLYIL